MLENQKAVEPIGELFQSPDVEAAREFFREKSRVMIDKRATVQEAVARFIHDGDYIATGGFGSVRIPTAVLHEIVRRKRNLGFAAIPPPTISRFWRRRVLDRCDIAYIVGLEPGGAVAKRAAVDRERRGAHDRMVTASLAWRIKAAAMELSSGARALGTDTERFQRGKGDHLPVHRAASPPLALFRMWPSSTCTSRYLRQRADRRRQHHRLRPGKSLAPLDPDHRAHCRPDTFRKDRGKPASLTTGRRGRHVPYGNYLAEMPMSTRPTRSTCRPGSRRRKTRRRLKPFRADDLQHAQFDEYLQASGGNDGRPAARAKPLKRNRRHDKSDPGGPAANAPRPALHADGLMTARQHTS